MQPPVVDALIPVHSSLRPIARGVASILEHTAAPTRVTVVAHNLDVEIIRTNLGAWADDERVTLLHLADGIPSPAGPLNLAISATAAPFFTILGSDDEFEPGAIDSWLALQRRSGAAMVIGRIHHAGRGNDPFPPVRPGRTRRLDPVKDRLVYRSAPLGLISRAVFGDLRFAAGLASGEDLPYITTMWFGGESIAFDRVGAAYLGHHDATDRVSFAPRPLAEDFAFLHVIEELPVFGRMTSRHREVFVVKLIRTHVFDALVARLGDAGLDEALRAEFAGLLARIESMAPGAARLLSRADRAALDALGRPGEAAADLAGLVARRANYRSVGAILPRNPALVLHRQAPLRTFIASQRVMRPVGPRV